jgi:hypothetical protein
MRWFALMTGITRLSHGEVQFVSRFIRDGRSNNGTANTDSDVGGRNTLSHLEDFALSKFKRSAAS